MDVVNTKNMNVPTADNAMLMDVQYVKANRKIGQKDYLYIIWKDLDTLEKHLKIIEEPSMEIFFEKPEYRNHRYNKTYAPIETLDRKIVKYKNIIYEIADDIGTPGHVMIQNCFETGNYDGLNELYLYPYVFGADYDIRTFYRYQWMKSFTNNRPKPITKGYMDIEVDLTNAKGFPKPEVDPVDLVTLVDTNANISYTFCLIGIESHSDDPEEQALAKKRAQLQEYYAENPNELIDITKEFFAESYPDIEFKVFFYKDEKKMLVHVFQLINMLKLDFIGFWNISFDIPYLINRCKALGLDPVQVMTHPDFPVKYCWFKKDTKNFEIKNQSDFFHISSYTIFYCHMRTYAAIRKGQSELRNNKLTYIAKRETGDEKLNYEEEGDLKHLSLKDWVKYFLYNIKDVLLECGIEERTQDLATYYFRSYKNLTPYENEFKQTVVLRNVQYRSFLEQGLVPGSNVNQYVPSKQNEIVPEEYMEDQPEDDDDGYEGALVGDPRLNDNFGIRMYGKRTNCIFNYSVDFDMSAFYPSCIRACNIDPSTLIFKMIMPAEQFDVRGGSLKFNGITDVQLLEDNDDSFQDDIAKECIDNFQTRHYLTFGHKWLNLPDVNEMDELLREAIGDE